MKKPYDQMEPYEKVVDTLMTYFISPVGQTITALHNNEGIDEPTRIFECRRALVAAGENCRNALTKRFPQIWDWTPVPDGGPVTMSTPAPTIGIEEKLTTLMKMIQKQGEDMTSLLNLISDALAKKK